MACQGVTCCPSGSLKANPKVLASHALFPPRQAGPRPTCAVSAVNGRSPICPRLALPVDRRGRPLGRRRQAAPSRRHGRQPGRRRGRMSGPSREAAGSPRAWRQQPHPTAVTGEEGGGRHVEAGDRLETGGRRALVVFIRTLQNLDGKTPIDVPSSTTRSPGRRPQPAREAHLRIDAVVVAASKLLLCSAVMPCFASLPTRISVVRCMCDTPVQGLIGLIEYSYQ